MNVDGSSRKQISNEFSVPCGSCQSKECLRELSIFFTLENDLPTVNELGWYRARFRMGKTYMLNSD